MYLACLAELPLLSFQSLEEQKKQALEDTKEALWPDVELHFKRNKETMRLAVMRKLELYKEMLQFSVSSGCCECRCSRLVTRTRCVMMCARAPRLR